MAETMEQTTAADHPLASRFIDVNEMDWTPTELPGIDMKLLYKDEEAGRSTILFRMAPGSRVPLHMHTDVEQTYILEGSLVDDQGACTAGNFVWRPGGNTHEAYSPDGALFISVFLKPNKFLDEPPAFANS
jgi:anti-sigma factor ChrR (cupin superfamily)